jgi:diguanylate cyclase (GGDEF)-like protein
MRSLALAALALAGALLSADEGFPEARNLRFERLSLEQGLSQSHVNCILQDRHGFLWLGTQDGLNRYDGYRFRVFKHDAREPGSLANNTVWAVFEDRDGVLWVGTDGGGLDRWDPSREAFVHYQHDPANAKSLSGNRVRAVLETKDGALWVGTDGAGLSRLDRRNGEFTRYRARADDPRGLSSDRVRFLMEDRDGALWIATDGGGLSRLDSARVNFTTYRNNPKDPGSLSADRVRHVYQDRDGVLWVGTYQAGLNRFEGGGRFTRMRKGPDSGSLANDRVRAVLQDRAGVLWIGTDGGLSEWRPESQRFVNHGHRDTDRTSLSDDRVLSLYQDRGGVLWVGTQGGGLNRWNTATGSFALVRSDAASSSSLTSNRVSAFASTPDDTLWVGTSAGLSRLDRRTGAVQSFHNDPKDAKSLSDDRVMSLLLDRSGRLWVGTYEGGLNQLDPATGRFRRFLPDPKDAATLSGPGISSMLEDREGRMWLGVFRGGLDRFDPASGKALHYRSAPDDPTSLSSDSVTALAQDRAGMIWVGTDGGGINRFDPASGKTTRFQNEPGNQSSLSSDAVFVVHEDRRGDLWVGTQGGGLNRWRANDRAAGRPIFARYTERDGLSNDTVYGILEEDSGNLWLSTNRGLSRLDPETGSFRNFDASHGLQSDEFNFGAYHQAASGEMYFGGIDGFNSFLPSRVSRNDNVPPVVLTSIQKLNREVRLGQDLADVRELTLDHRDYVVSFEFAALDYAAPERNRYAYKLEGLDHDWVAAGSARRASYTNLQPGHYVFRVKGSNGDGVWNEDGVALKLTVEPPPWRSVWAYAAYALLALGGLLLYGRSQEKRRYREIEYSHRLEQQVQDRTAELAQRNDELQLLNRKLEDASLTDSLTGLSNRRFLMAQMPQDVAVVERYYRRLDPKASPPLPGNRPDFALMMIDLDGLKGVNDTYGHAAGDRVLMTIREILERACRKSDTLVRWGGDEFLVVARYVEPEVVEALAERIRRAVEEHAFDLGQGRPVHLGCSIGFALYPFLTATPNLLTWEQVGSIADRALYAAKSSGRNTWVGILATANTPTEDVVHLVSHRPATLVREGSIEVRSSLADPNALVWERHVVPRESEPLVVGSQRRPA